MKDETSGLPETESLSSAQTDGQRIGNYRVLGKIGEGGMGEVYEAEQLEPVRRKVALKLIKAGMDSKQVVARFESERQALALMSHPNVARVFDAGVTEQGRPFFAMEYVPGEPLTTYCDRHRLDTASRLELFMRVCQGIQHAHQKGIIHRDIKPSNVLVQIQDDTPLPKVIDFGLAKATQQRLTDKTMATVMGQILGTPEYMSPEQAEMTGLDVDTRTDVYSLGVLLYQLLVGVLPFESKKLREASFDEVRRTIREEEPTKPSTRLSTLGDVSKETARQRRTDPASLRRELRGDLDWITLKALEKDRTRRYGSPSELAADVERHLKHEPVLASPPSTLYRAGKFFRRHRVGVIASSLVLVALLIGIAGTVYGLVRARQEAETARRVSEFLIGMFADLRPTTPQENLTTPEAILGRGTERIETDLAGQPLVQARLMTTIGHAYSALGQSERARTVHEKALAILRENLDDDHPAVLMSTSFLGDTLSQLGEYGEAQRLHEIALAGRQRALGSGHIAVAWSLRSLAYGHWKQSRFETALGFLGQSLAIQEELPGDNDLDLARTLFMQAMVERDAGEYEAARAGLERVLAIREKILGPEHTDVGWALFELGLLDQHTNRSETARELFERARRIQEAALEPDHPSLAFPLNELGVLLTREGEYDRARSLIERALGIRERALGPNHPDVAWSLSALAYLLRQTGDLDASREHLERGLAIQERVLGPEHFEVARTLGFLADLERTAGNDERARQLLERVLTIRRNLFGPGDRRLAVVLYNLGCVVAILGERDEALALLREALDCGFAGRVMLDDPDLSSLRGDTKFESLVTEVRSRLGED